MSCHVVAKNDSFDVMGISVLAGRAFREGDAYLDGALGARKRQEAVALHKARLSQGPTRAAAQRGNAVHQRQQLRHVVPVRRREARDERNP